MNSNNFDLTKLSQSDIVNLRSLLGIETVQNKENDSLKHSGVQELFGNPLHKLSTTFEIDSADISGGESPLHEIPSNITAHNDMTSALFEEGELVDENEWDLPRLKAPLKGTAVPQSLANMINLACTSLCETDPIVSKYKIPVNCDKACAPLVNSEIWKVMDKRTQTQDRSMAEIRNLVATGMTPLVQLADILKTQFSGNSQAKSLLGDALTIMGQVQYHMSVRRRYMIRPTLSKERWLFL